MSIKYEAVSKNIATTTKWKIVPFNSCLDLIVNLINVANIKIMNIFYSRL